MTKGYVRKGGAVVEVKLGALIPAWESDDEKPGYERMVGMDLAVLDMEGDPVNVSIDCDGIAQIETDDFAYIMFSPEQMRFIAHKAEVARDRIARSRPRRENRQEQNEART